MNFVLRHLIPESNSMSLLLGAVAPPAGAFGKCDMSQTRNMQRKTSDSEFQSEGNDGCKSSLLLHISDAAPESEDIMYSDKK